MLLRERAADQHANLVESFFEVDLNPVVFDSSDKAYWVQPGECSSLFAHKMPGRRAWERGRSQAREELQTDWRLAQAARGVRDHVNLTG